MHYLELELTTRFVDFSRYSSIGIGGVSRVFVFGFADVGAVLSSSGLEFRYGFVTTDRSMLSLGGKSFRFIGMANNILVSPDVDCLSFLGSDFDYICDLGDVLEIGASCPSFRAYSYFKCNNLGGLEFLSHLPGNIGGLTNMNAGMKNYELGSVIREVNINGEWVDVDDVMFTYRGRRSGGVIFAIRVLKIVGFNTNLARHCKLMRHNQPSGKSCGSCFKNPPGYFAGKLLEEHGLKGYHKNGVGFSDVHANFLVNRGNASFDDAIEVIDIAKNIVSASAGIKLECEVEIILN